VPYTAAKAGVIGMMLNLRMELAQCGVGCTVLCPGGVATRIHETPRYRPARFGGPSQERLKAAPRAFVQHTEKLQFRPPEEVARMVLDAVRADRAIVVTDASQREIFLQRYVDVVLSAFDDAAAFDHAKNA
jgi:NAD(P)-dependent dehydrogenase (short-subunit alcohol dehydrogenase family)